MKRTKCLIAAALAFVPTMGALSSTPVPANILLAHNRAETSIAVDARSPSNIIVGSNTNYDLAVGGTYPTAFFSSTNGGRSFSFSAVPVRTPYTTGADPTVVYGVRGTVYFSYLGETPSYCSGGRSAVMVSRSFDRGRNFTAPIAVDTDPADDKPFLAAGNGAANRRVFLVWTRWHDKGSDIWIAVSRNSGRSFHQAVELYGSRLDNFGPQIVSAADGYLYEFWTEFPEMSLTAVAPARILMRVSRDNGDHFGPVRIVRPWFSSIPRMSQPGSLRNLTMSSVGSDGAGTLYASWAQVIRRHAGDAVDAAIEISKSSDHGITWSYPVRVNDFSQSDRFMPALAILGRGSVGVAFYDRRAGPAYLDLYAAHVTFRGARAAVSRNMRVSRWHSPVSRIYYYAPGSTCFSPGRFFGDYLGAAACGSGYMCVTWTDAQLQARKEETQIWFARVLLPK